MTSLPDNRMQGDDTTPLGPQFLYTEILQMEARHLTEIRWELEEAGLPTDDVDYQLGIVRRELQRRHNLYTRRGALHDWPNGDRRLTQRKQALDAYWTLERFLTDVAQMPLAGHGVERAARCPFHDSKSGTSFTVNIAKQVWHCFGCHKGGDLYTFVGERFGLPEFVDQVRKLDEITHGLARDARSAAEAATIEVGVRR